MSRKDREFAFLLHTEQLAANRAVAQEKAAIERDRVAVEREKVAAQRAATKAQDRVSITLEEYLKMREKIAALEREKEFADGIFARIRLPYELLESVDQEKVERVTMYDPDRMDFAVHISFKVHPCDELTRNFLMKM